MDVLQAISGNRVNYSMNRIGGVNRDIDDPLAVRRCDNVRANGGFRRLAGRGYELGWSLV